MINASDLPQSTLQKLLSPYQVALHALYKKPLLAFNWKLKPEERITIELADLLREASFQGRLDVCWYHVGNEGKRHKIVGQILRRMGLIPGVYDFCFLAGRFAGMIEIKRPDQFKLSEKTGKLIKSNRAGEESDNQKHWGAILEHHGVHKQVCFSAGEAIDTLKRWGVYHDSVRA